MTPLPWPIVLAAFARADALTVLARAKVLGLVAWSATGAAIGGAAARARTAWWAKAGVLAAVALSVPLAAHSVSGMETALATGLATLAVLLGRRGPVAVGAVAGLAATLRPELAAWALVVTAALGAAHRATARPDGTSPALAGAWSKHMALAQTLALAPFVACALLRTAVWGRPAPLALLAKPSDLAHGLPYAAAGFVVTLVPLLVVAPLSLRRKPRALAIVVAAAAHFGAVAAVGGDWMPYARLLVPVVPSLALAALMLAECARPLATATRTVVALALGALLVPRAQAGRAVGSDRAALVHAAAPALVGLHRIAALDIGWLSAATDADILDLGGVTDPGIASLPGGQTSKRVDSILLLSRDPDALLLYAPEGLPPDGLASWADASFPRAVEARLARDDLIARRFTPAAWLPLGARGGYVLLVRRD